MTPPHEEAHRSELDKLWDEIAALRGAVGDLKTQLAVGDANRQHLRDDVKLASDKVSALTGKIDALILTIAQAQGGVTAGTWIVRTLGGAAIALIVWIASHYHALKPGGTPPWAP